MKIHKLAQIEKACTTDATRAALLHPYIDTTKPETPVIVATNSRIMAVVPVTEADRSGYVPASALKAARKLKTPGEFYGTDLWREYPPDHTFKWCVIPSGERDGVQFPRLASGDAEG